MDMVPNNAHIRPPGPPVGAAADWTIPQRWAQYTPAEHAIWNRLFTRQLAQLQDRAVPAFLAGVQALGMKPTGIPRFEDLNEALDRLTGWTVVAVPGLVPEEVFFHHLAHRQFVAGRFIRSAAQLDYLEEPDVFHDVFGHVPLLADPVYASYMQAYGEAGSRLHAGSALTELARLYWYTVEFGLIRDGDRLRIFGAGIVSSNGESEYALDSPEPLRIGFDLKRTMLTDYRIDSFQKNYFVIDSFEDLVRRTSVDFRDIYKELEGIAPIPVATRLPTDILFAPNPGR
ncbi:MAG TPA: phenylalanine 4-monooxygenase [Steroidobacteraceae bacterium]|nr:phenylalanine 4-monooxygenase [Steroidobacteraceae bacterium]